MPFDILDIFLVAPPFSDDAGGADSGALPGQYATLRSKLYRRAKLIAAYGSSASQPAGVTTTYDLSACCCGVVTVCCPDHRLPPTSTSTVTANGVTLSTFALTVFANVTDAHVAYPADFNSYYASDGAGYYAESLCPTDSDLRFHILMWCTAAGAWRLAFQVESVSGVTFLVSWFGGNDVVWLAGKGGSGETDFELTCYPFHCHWEGTNTGAGSAATLCGFSYDGNPASATLVFDAVAP